MPAATIDPPIAAAPIAAPAPKAAPAAAPKAEVKVSQMPTDKTPTVPGSAKERMFKEMDKRFGGEQSPAAASAAPSAAASEGAATAAAPSPEAEGRPAAEGAPSPEETAAVAAAAKDGKKLSPWKLVDQFKARAVAAEAKALELEKQVIPEPERKKLTETLKGYEERLKAMQEDLRYFNAEKYDPDILKANADYETAWKRAMGELNEITLTDPQTQASRPVSGQDLLELVNLPLGKAREIADQYFGVFADDVMAHRKEIRNLFESKLAKLEELKKNGGERDSQRQKQWQEQAGGIAKHVKEVYEQENASATKDPHVGKYFSEREGNEDWNNRLKKGFELVDQAYRENSMDPRLSPEQRAAIARRHAAVRNRAASWGPLRWYSEQLEAKVATLEADLAKFKISTPPTSGSFPGTAAPASGSAKDRMFADLAKLAKTT